MPQTYRCNECGWPIFTAEGVSGGTIKLPCPNNQCPSKRVQPVRRQTYTFDDPKKK